MLVYDLTEDGQQSYDEVTRSLEELARSGRLRAVRMVGHHTEWKRNAGATRSMDFDGAQLTKRDPPHVVTNVTPWTLRLKTMDLIFLPDRLLVWSRGRYAGLSYAELGISTHSSNFVWDESVPKDARVVGHTWRFVRRDGGPDRRFNGNRRIPLVLTAYLALESATGLNVLLQSTRETAPPGVLRALKAHASRAKVASTSHEADPVVAAALAVLGLTTIPTATELKQLYRALAQRNHPDKFARASAEIRQLANARMQEINQAHATLRQRVALRPEAEEKRPPELETAPDPQDVTVPDLEWMAVVVAAAAAVVVLGSSAPPSLRWRGSRRRAPALPRRRQRHPRRGSPTWRRRSGPASCGRRPPPPPTSWVWCRRARRCRWCATAAAGGT